MRNAGWGMSREDKDNTATPIWNGDTARLSFFTPAIVCQKDAMSCIEYILDHEEEDYYEQEPEDRLYHIYKCALDALGLKERENKDD